MRLFGHPVHVMLVHFPIALWPAHAALHFFAARLPLGASSVAGFWLLMGGVILGWLAALTGAVDLLELSRDDEPRQLNRGVVHGVVNGGVLLGFTALVVLEYADYPVIEHGIGFLLVELGLLSVLAVGNYLGGAMIWEKSASSSERKSAGDQP